MYRYVVVCLSGAFPPNLERKKEKCQSGKKIRHKKGVKVLRIRCKCRSDCNVVVSSTKFCVVVVVPSPWSEPRRTLGGEGAAQGKKGTSAEAKQGARFSGIVYSVGSLEGFKVRGTVADFLLPLALPHVHRRCHLLQGHRSGLPRKQGTARRGHREATSVGRGRYCIQTFHAAGLTSYSLSLGDNYTAWPHSGQHQEKADVAGSVQAPEAAGGFGVAAADGDVRQEWVPRGGLDHTAAVLKVAQAVGISTAHTECFTGQITMSCDLKCF